ncbi:ECF transporter S component [Mycoplasmopsis pullorum]|uniref:ECF transporter S component n=1 Tax=Mycoplasmopsis pullorum TaxID=48003 RepID=UPI00111A71EC|nr:ECF transporter S component [Mycoplasmopsis pullorum]TNK81653.1 ECF transporter S component [Mycoplasmopsis pullorum]TNK82093.1 ECF transporter S component [Mycoplasmopsis pullorum]TNK83928.1 ECF transporter S component [Mycoplasmopsis pullorum]TNK84246.1 ECF transporter S component [Mycoplasmopsis pullorum]TNK84950.1 ECF transporter S component [Mycoplasmopsis pullorum]
MYKTTQQIVYLSIYFALTLILTLIPNVGLIQIGVVSINLATLIIPLMVVHLRKLGILSGLFVGAGSFLAAIFYGKALFIYPDVSVLPRVLVGIAIYFIYEFLGKINFWKALVLGFSSAFLNTLFVSIFLLLHNWVFPFDFFANQSVNPIKFWFILILPNIIAEPIALTILVGLMTPLFVYFEKSRQNTIIHY